MKLAMAQMRMTDSMEENLRTSLEMCALARGSDLLFFPEIQLTPFFPQYEKRDVSKYALTPDFPSACNKDTTRCSISQAFSQFVYIRL